MHKNGISAPNTMQLKEEGMPNPSELKKGIPKYQKASPPNPCIGEAVP